MSGYNDPTHLLAGPNLVLLDGATASLASTLLAWPDSNLRVPTLDTFARTTSGALADTILTVDLSEAGELPVRVVAIAGHNAAYGSQWRVAAMDAGQSAAVTELPHDDFQLLAQGIGTYSWDLPVGPLPAGPREHVVKVVLRATGTPGPVTIEVGEGSVARKVVQATATYREYWVAFSADEVGPTGLEVTISSTLALGLDVSEPVRWCWSTYPAGAVVTPWMDLLEPITGPGGLALNHLPPPTLRTAAVDLTAGTGSAEDPNPHTVKAVYRVEFRLSELGDDWLDVAFPLVGPAIAEGYIPGSEAQIQVDRVGGEQVVTPGGALRTLPAVARPRRQELRIRQRYVDGLQQAVAGALLGGLWSQPFLVMTAPGAIGGGGGSVTSFLAVEDVEASEAITIMPSQVPAEIEYSLQLRELS